MAVVLYGFWRSLASFRVRAALNLKGVAYREQIVDLTKGEQFLPAYHSLNPQNVLPLLEHDGLRLTQSLAIVEYINDTWSQESLLPPDAAGKARVRSLAQIASADVHPLIVPRVRNYLEQEFGLDEASRLKWVRHWFMKGTEAIETRLASDGHAGQYSHGDRVTMADLALASHVVGARLFQVDLSSAPRLEAIVDRFLQLDAVARAHPLAQPGAPSRPG
jgi:maleylacetoacetate isomerase